MILCVPPLEEKPWPTLGPQVCDFIETYLIYGPGDLRGQPARLSIEERALIYRMYEVYPRKHEFGGRRRFKRVGISKRKGTAKTEKAAWITAVELHPDGPVRCVGWDRRGRPLGGGVKDPYIPMVAYTEEQSEELAYGTLLVVLSEGPLAPDFDIGLQRIMRRNGDGKAVALATAPDARDGARTTFQVFDETHRFTLPRLKAAHRTMMANIPKRKLADAWSLEVTTAPAPGEGSVAEATMDYAKAVANGQQKDSKLFYFHRQASDTHDLATAEGRRAAVLEASGPDAEWSDIEGILDLAADPTTDIAYWARVWTNQLLRSTEQAFDIERWKALAKPGEVFGTDEPVALGFDGARYQDSTALIGSVIPTGHLFVLGIWERPEGFRDDAEWEVPELEVDAAVTEAFETLNVWGMYGDPYFWESWLSAWCGRWGDKVKTWPTNRTKPMAEAVQKFAGAIMAGELSHDGNEALTRHMGNARRRLVPVKDLEGRQLWVIQKERSDSPHKMDGAMAACLAHEARSDAIASGVLEQRQAGVFFA